MKEKSSKNITEYILGSVSIAFVPVLLTIIRLKQGVMLKDFLYFTLLQLLIMAGAFFLISTVSKDFLTKVLGMVAVISSQSVIYVLFDTKSIKHALAFSIALTIIALALRVLYGENRIYLFVVTVLLLSGAAYLSINDFIVTVGIIFLLYVLNRRKEWLILSLCPLALSIPAFIRHYMLDERLEAHAVFYQPLQVPSLFIYRDNLPGLGLGCCLLLVVCIYVFFINQTKDEKSFIKKYMIAAGILIILSLDIPIKNVVNSLLYLRGIPVVSSYVFIEYATVLMVLAGCSATGKMVKEDNNRFLKSYVQIFIIALSLFSMVYTSSF